MKTTKELIEELVQTNLNEDGKPKALLLKVLNTISILDEQLVTLAVESKEVSRLYTASWSMFTVDARKCLNPLKSKL